MSKRIRTALTGAGVSLALSAVVLGGTAFAQDDSPTSGTGLNLPFVNQIVNASSNDDGAVEAPAGAHMFSYAIGDQDAPPDGITEFGTNDAPSGGSGFGFHMAAGPNGALGCHIDFATIAAELGISEEDVQAEFEAGASLAEIITGHGSTVEDVVDALVAEAQADAQAAVDAGEVTQEQADQFLSDLPEHLAAILNDDFSAPALPAHPGAGGEDATPDESPAEETGTV